MIPRKQEWLETLRKTVGGGRWGGFKGRKGAESCFESAPVLKL